MRQYISLVVTVLTVTEPTYSTASFKLLATFTGLTENNGTTESCAFDRKNDRWVVFDQYYLNAEVDTLPGTYPGFYRSYEWNKGEQTDAYEYDEVVGTEYVASADGDYSIFFADATGTVGRYDVDNDNTPDTYPIGTPGTNGICYDSTTNTIYATNPGIDFQEYPWIETDADAGIWKITLTDANPSAERVYTGGDTINDQNGNNYYKSGTSNNYVFRPNGCASKDGVVYFVETRSDGTGVLGMLSAGSDVLSIDDSKATISGDGIVVIGDFIIYSSWRAGGTGEGVLFYWDTTDADGTFMLGIDGLTSPANIGVGPRNTICIPSLTTGNIYFVRFSTRQFMEKLPNTFILNTKGDGSGDVGFAYSVFFDPKRKAFAFINQLTADSANKPDLNELDVDWAADETGAITDNGFIGLDTSRDTVIPTRTTTDKGDIVPYYYDGVIVNDILYGIGHYGIFFAQELETEHVIGYVDIGDYVSQYNLDTPSATGVCSDPDNMNNVYVVDGYSGNIYRIDITTLNTGTSQFNAPVKLYDASQTTVTDSNMANPRQYLPYKCTIVDGKMYMVECYTCNHPDQSGVAALGIYTLNDDTFIYNSDIFDKSASAIASSANGIIVIAPLVLVDSTTNIYLVGFGLYEPGVDAAVDFQIYESIDLDQEGFSVGIAIDYYNGVFASMEDIGSMESKLIFYKAYGINVPTPKPTSDPSAMPTKAPNAVDDTGSTATPTSKPTDDKSKASDIIFNMLHIALFIAFMVNYVN